MVAGESVAAGLSVTNTAPRRLLPTMLELPVGAAVQRYAVPSLGPRGVHEETFTVRTERRGVIEVGPATTRRGDPLSIYSRDVAWTGVTEILVRPADGAARLARGRACCATSRASRPTRCRRATWPSTPCVSTSPATTCATSTGVRRPRPSQLLVRQYLDTRRSHATIVVDDDSVELGHGRRLRDRHVGGRVDRGARRARRVRGDVRLRRAGLLRLRRHPRPRRGVPGRPDRLRPGGRRQPGGPHCPRHQPAVPGQRRRPPPSRRSSAPPRCSRPRYAGSR